MSVIGTWNGYFEYGLGYGLPEFGERVTFQLTLEATEDGFLGPMQDEDSPYGTEAVTSVTGFEDDGLISFVRTYDQGELLKGSSQEALDGSLEVRFSGNYDTQNDACYGIWEISEEVELEGQKMLRRSEGLWLMRRG